MNVKEKINGVIEILNEIDEYDEGLADKLSVYDSKLSDLYHIVEENKLKTNECYRIIQEMHKVLIERRKIKDDISLLSVYKKEKERLLNDRNRAFLRQSIFKKDRELRESVYKNRVYTDEQINGILKIKSEGEDVWNM